VRLVARRRRRRRKMASFHRELCRVIGVSEDALDLTLPWQWCKWYWESCITKTKRASCCVRHDDCYEFGVRNAPKPRGVVRYDAIKSMLEHHWASNKEALKAAYGRLGGGKRSSTKTPTFHVAYLGGQGSAEDYRHVVLKLMAPDSSWQLNHRCGCGMDCCNPEHVYMGTQVKNVTIDKAYHLVLDDVAKTYGVESKRYKRLKRGVRRKLKEYDLL